MLTATTSAVGVDSAVAARVNPHVQQLRDTSELIELSQTQCLYLKPISRANVTVTLPTLKNAGQSISNWDLMERLKKLVRPVNLESIRVTKSTLEFVRFEADVENKTTLKKVLKTLDGCALKVIGFFETLKVRAAEAKSDCPTRHDWDTFFRESTKMNELHSGERPDTVYLAQLPCNWFTDLRKAPTSAAIPSDYVLRRVFETFGTVRSSDMPVTDAYRRGMTKTGIRQASSGLGTDVTFEAYVQFVEYISFARCMDTLRGMKLVHVADTGRAAATNIIVDFDRTKHLSDKAIRRRRLEREKLAQIEQLQNEETTAKMIMAKAAAERVQTQALTRRSAREERRRLKGIQKRRAQEQMDIERRIATEERALLVAQRKLQSIRILTHVLKRIQIKRAGEQLTSMEAELEAAVMRDVKIKELRRAVVVKQEEGAPSTSGGSRARRRDDDVDRRRQPSYRREPTYRKHREPPTHREQRSTARPERREEPPRRRDDDRRDIPVVRANVTRDADGRRAKIQFPTDKHGGSRRHKRDDTLDARIYPAAAATTKSRSPRASKAKRRRRRSRSSSGELMEQIVYEYDDGHQDVVSSKRLDARRQTQNIILQQKLAEMEMSSGEETLIEVKYEDDDVVLQYDE